MNIQTDLNLTGALDALRQAEKAAKGTPEQEAIAKLAQCLNRLLQDRGYTASARRKLQRWTFTLQLQVDPRTR